MTTDQKQYLQEIIRREFEFIFSKQIPEFIKQEQAEELYQLCYEALELDNSFIDELKKDAKVK